MPFCHRNQELTPIRYLPPSKKKCRIFKSNSKSAITVCGSNWSHRCQRLPSVTKMSQHCLHFLKEIAHLRGKIEQAGYEVIHTYMSALLQSLPLGCLQNWRHESMLVHLNIPSLQQRRLQLKANMMYQFVHGVSYIPEDILFLHPPSNYDIRNCYYFSVPYARTNAYYYSFFHTLHFWNSLPPTVAHAPSTSVFKRLIEFYV